MGIIDIVILVIIIAGFIIGYTSGIIKQITSICAIVVGIIACHLFGDWATGVLVEIVPETANWPAPEYTTCAIANIILFLIIFLGIKVVGAMFKSAVTKLHLGLFDRLAGGLFSVFKYLLIASIVLNVAFVIVPGCSMFTRSHSSGNILSRITMNLAPALLGVDNLPQLLNDLNDSLEEK